MYKQTNYNYNNNTSLLPAFLISIMVQSLSEFFTLITLLKQSSEFYVVGFFSL